MFFSKEFIKQITNNLSDFEFGYYHYNHPKTTKDILIEYKGFPKKFIEKQKFVKEDNTLNINSWIGVYNQVHTTEPPFFWNGGINYKCLHDTWGYIFSQINSHFGTDIKLKSSLNEYVPTINYELFDTSCYDDYIKSRSGRKKILFCNGVAMSGQSFADDMSSIILYFSKKYDQVDFICTKKFNIPQEINNIFFTDDFQVTNDENILETPFWNDRKNTICDLNEISYLSRYCDVIVGKNSGPFVYCMTKENFSTEGKVIISFNKDMEDSLGYGVDLECEYIFSNIFELNSIVSIIEEKICQL